MTHLLVGHIKVTLERCKLNDPNIRFLQQSLRFYVPYSDRSSPNLLRKRTSNNNNQTVLSRPQMPHYSLTVQAADEGVSPLSSAVLIAITVSDVNDNPPVFSRVNYSLTVQVTAPT